MDDFNILSDYKNKVITKLSIEEKLLKILYMKKKKNIVELVNKN